MFKTIKTLIAVAALSGTVGANVQAKEVTVQKGDTFWELSQVHNASIENIKSWNQLASDFIQKEDILKIATKKHYTVKQGDSLISIANENNVSAQNLIEWNNLYTNLVHPGLNLVIFDNSTAPDQMEPVKQATSTTETPLESLATAVSPAQDGTKVSQTSSTSSLVDTITHQENATVPVNNISETTAQAPAAPTTESTPTAVQVPTPASTPAPTPTPTPTTVPAPTTLPAPTTSEPVPAPAETQSEAPKEITVKATAYTADCEGCSGITATGVNLKANPNDKVIAVDPSVIPLGSKVYIEGYGEATAADTGGAIKGNRIDVYMQNESDALQFGAKELTVKILN
ncbi:MAG: 3D domain-containing protein [Bacillota bacterium]|nr:3D domain-containing protein [Bacillota bacterium]